MRYPFTTEPDGDTILITCPLLAEVTSFAEADGEEAQGHASDAIRTAFMGRMADREIIPLPTGEVVGRAIHLSPLEVLKIELHNAMVTDGVRKAELGRRLHVHPPQVDRLLDMDHASKLDQLQLALAAMHRVIEVRVHAV